MLPSPMRFTTLSVVVLLYSASLFAAPGTEAPAPAAHDHHPASCPFMTSSAGHEMAGPLPEQIGQDAFAALAEMRDLLTADPTTDWSQVDFDALREHLVDMNRVVLHAEVAVQPLPAGFRAQVTGSGRTLDAIHRMVPAHARFADGRDGLHVTVSELPNAGGAENQGVVVTVTTDDPSAVAQLQGLGFFGFLVAGDHHRPHHRAIALGAGHP